MALIPQEVFDIYNEFADDFINDNFGVNCTIYYPPKSIACSNCQTDPIGQKVANRFQHGAPSPFIARGCDFCGGSGYKESVVNETIKLRIYDEPKHWIKISSFANVADGDVQIIGFLSDSPKLQSANYIIVNSDQAVFGDFKYQLASECLPHGFKKNRYFIALLKRV
jgi:hypothetical protein